MIKYQPKFDVNDNTIGMALKTIAVITFICGGFVFLVLVADDNVAIGLVALIGAVITGIFILGFAEIIALLTDIKYKMYEEVSEEFNNGQASEKDIEEELPDL